MQATFEIREPFGAHPRAVTVIAGEATSPLVHDADVGAGVLISVDLLDPSRWHRIAVTSVDDARPVLTSVLGPRAAAGLGSGGAAGLFAIDVGGGQTWLRAAVVDALDRWLHLPLAQGVVDAERAVARRRAAGSMPAGVARDAVVGDALRLARRGSAEFAHHLRRLAVSTLPVADELHAAVSDLVEGYAALTALVGPDRELSAVLRAYEAARGRAAIPAAARRARRRGHRQPASGSMIDPRQVRARVLALSNDPATGEVLLSAGERDEAHIMVPVFAPTTDDDVAERLRVRLVDRLSSVPVAYGVLTADRRRGTGRRYLRGTVPLNGYDLSTVRADVYDALDALPPVLADSGLHEARRAAVFLSEWRRLVALARVSSRSAPADRLRALARTIRPCGGDPRSPAFSGGPSPAELGALSARVDVGERLREAGAEAVTGVGPLGSAQGVGHLTVAELLSARVEAGS